VFRKLTVEDNVMAILETRPDLERAARQQRLEQLLEELRIGHVRRILGMALSGGERRRVEIARALAAEPRIMLLDEPFAGVDPLSVLDIQRIIRELTHRGIGVLITDHNVRETLGSAPGPTSSIRARSLHPGVRKKSLPTPKSVRCTWASRSGCECSRQQKPNTLFFK